MNDLISRQAVLKLLSTIPPEEAMTKAMLIQSVKQMDSETVTECNNLISRQAAIDALKAAYWDKNIQSAKDDPCIVDAMTDWAIRKIKGLPSAQRWIPCSKQLPKKSGQYYVSGGGKVWICEFLIIPNFFAGGWCNDVSNPAVQAWMPPPQPYRENEVDDEKDI